MKDQKQPALLAATLACLLSGAAPSTWAAPITFDARENLNILNSPDVTITASHYRADLNDSGNALRGAAYDSSTSGIGWYSGSFPVAEKEVLTIDLGAERNIETIRLNGERILTAATIETSSDGVNWSSPLSHTTTTTGLFDGLPQPTTFVLDSATDAKWIRITGEGYAQEAGGERSMALANLRIYGSAGSVVADPGLDLVSSTAWTAGAATITSNSLDFTPGTTMADMADDNHANLGSRQLIFSLGNGDHVTVSFAVTVDDISRVGFTFANRPGASFDTDMHFQILGATDGVNFSTVLLDQTGGLIAGPNFFDLANTFTGNAVRLLIVSSTGGDNRVADMFVFQEIPEPASLSLLALGAAIMLRRSKTENE